MNVEIKFAKKHFSSDLSEYVLSTIKGCIENYKDRLFKDDTISIPMEEIGFEIFRIVEVIFNFSENTIIYVIE